MGVIENFEALLAKGQDSALLRFGLGSAYLKEGDADKAATHLRHAVEQDPNYSAAWKLYGKALAATGNSAEAIAAYETGIRAAEARGDIQAAKEMKVFLKRLQKPAGAVTKPGGEASG
jgi:predicted Zn-dependent protease